MKNWRGEKARLASALFQLVVDNWIIVKSWREGHQICTTGHESATRGKGCAPAARFGEGGGEGEGVKRTESQKRERTNGTGRNKTVISRHFTHERERLADSTCVPALCRFPAAVKCPSLFSSSLDGSLILSVSLPLALQRALYPFHSCSITYTLTRLCLKNTALADTCSFGTLHMCARSTSSCRRRRLEEMKGNGIDNGRCWQSS